MGKGRAAGGARLAARGAHAGEVARRRARSLRPDQRRARAAQTTGGEGLHVQVPIERRHTHAQARDFCEDVAGAVVRSTDGLVTTERSLARRNGVFVDTKMNGHGQQVVSV